MEVYSLLPSVAGLQWGDFCGSPVHPHPTIQLVHTSPKVAKKIITSTNNLSAFLCGSNICILIKCCLSDSVNPIGLLTWGHHDTLLHVHAFDTNRKSTFNPMRPDDVTCCEYVHSLGILFVGGASGVLNVWPVGFSIQEVLYFHCVYCVYCLYVGMCVHVRVRVCACVRARAYVRRL